MMNTLLQPKTSLRILEDLNDTVCKLTSHEISNKVSKFKFDKDGKEIQRAKPAPIPTKNEDTSSVSSMSAQSVKSFKKRDIKLMNKQAIVKEIKQTTVSIPAPPTKTESGVVNLFFETM